MRRGFLGGVLMLAAAGVGLFGVSASAQRVLIINSEGGTGGGAGSLSAALTTVGFTTVDILDVTNVTPTLADLSSYQAVVAYTDLAPQNSTALGNVLADYIDAGGGVVAGEFGFSDPDAIGGRFQTAGYSPLVNLGAKGNVSGSLHILAPGDPLFAGLGTVVYANNSNFAHPGLDPSATLLADDGAGVNMIARSANGKVLGVNFYPSEFLNGNNANLYSLIANGALGVAAAGSTAPVPEPGAFAMLAGAMAGTMGVTWRRRGKA